MVSEFERNRLIRENNRQRRALYQQQRRHDKIESIVDVALFIVFLWILCFWAAM